MSNEDGKGLMWGEVTKEMVDAVAIGCDAAVRRAEASEALLLKIDADIANTTGDYIDLGAIRTQIRGHLKLDERLPDPVVVDATTPCSDPLPPPSAEEAERERLARLAWDVWSASTGLDMEPWIAVVDAVSRAVGEPLKARILQLEHTDEEGNQLCWCGAVSEEALRCDECGESLCANHSAIIEIDGGRDDHAFCERHHVEWKLKRERDEALAKVGELQAGPHERVALGSEIGGLRERLTRAEGVIRELVEWRDRWNPEDLSGGKEWPEWQAARDLLAESTPPTPSTEFTTPDCPACGCVQDGHCLCVPSADTKSVESSIKLVDGVPEAPPIPDLWGDLGPMPAQSEINSSILSLICKKASEVQEWARQHSDLGCKKLADRMDELERAESRDTDLRIIGVVATYADIPRDTSHPVARQVRQAETAEGGAQ